MRVLYLVIFLFISCNINNTKKDCFYSYKIIKGQLRETSFKFDKKFLLIDNKAKKALNELILENVCLNHLTPTMYLFFENKKIYILKNNDNNGVILYNDSNITKKIIFENYDLYSFKGISSDAERIKIFLDKKGVNEVIVIKEKKDYILWNIYEW